MMTFNPEEHRPYLKLLARLHLSKIVQRRFDASDVVQEAIFEALRTGDLFRGDTNAQFSAWLRAILFNQIARHERDPRRSKRDIRREQSLQARLDDSSHRLVDFLAADQTSPSEPVRKNEMAMRLAAALEKLPDDQREALVLHYFEALTVQAVGERMNKARGAVWGLLQRGLTELRRLLAEKE